MTDHTLTIISPYGTEQLIIKELTEFGAKEITNNSGAVSCKASLETAYRACLWSRFASRILCRIRIFSVHNEDDLYRRIRAIDWTQIMYHTTTFAINCTLQGETTIHNNRFASQKMKDGIVDFFRDHYNERPSVQKKRPELQFHLHISKTKNDQNAEVFIDLSGESLHRRGYRTEATLAPLKENLAATLVALSSWRYDTKEPLIDPMCGSGTLLIEAAMMTGDVAPGISRSYFGFFGWKEHDQKLWESLIEEAGEREEKGLHNYTTEPLFIGYDSDPLAVKAARKNITKAGLAEYIKVYRQDLALLDTKEIGGKKNGTILSNLPFGERLSEKEIITRLYQAFGKIIKERFPQWQCSVFISNPELTDAFTIHWNKKESLFNGAIPCRLLTANIREQKKEEEFSWELSEKDSFHNDEDDVKALANRLRKNFQRLNKWRKKERVDCFRLYDSDLPEFNFSLDLYEKWFHLQEYAPPKSIDTENATKRIQSAKRVIQKLFGIHSNRIFIKRRERQKGHKQYEKNGNSRKMYKIHEGDATLLVNFTDYIDTGLFLDHRPTRKIIYEMANGKRFLNLFGYTGSATVHAGLGGAVSTTTIDLSATYCHWAKMNMALNGFSEFRHRVIQADSMQWLTESSDYFDLIFLDPPTFSNTKKEKRIFDIQRDHVQLIELAMNRLERNGILFFSTNFRRFQLDKELHNKFSIIELTNSIPPDFSRNTKVHQCWQFHLQ